MALCDGERRRLARTRRRSDVPEAATAESEGEKVGEEEEKARNLTALSNRSQEGRKRKFDGRGGAPATAMTAAVFWAPIWPGSGSIELEKGWWSFGAM